MVKEIKAQKLVIDIPVQTIMLYVRLLNVF